MMLGEAIIARLEADAAVTAIVADRIYWLVRPQGETLPALVLQAISEERTQHLKGFDDMFEARVQVAAQSERYSESRALAEAAIAALIDVAEVDAATGDVVFWRGSVDGPRDLGNQEETRFVHRAVADLVIRYKAIAPPPPPPLPVPLAVADFKSGVYSIGGVAKTFDEMYLDRTEEGPPFSALVITPGVGAVGASIAGVFQNFYTEFTPELYAAVDPLPDGCSFVLDYSLTASGTADITFGTAGFNGDTTENWAATFGFKEDDDEFSRAAIIGDYYYDNLAYESFFEGPHRSAVSFHPSELALSTDGATPLTIAPATLTELGSLWYNYLLVDARDSPAGEALGIIEKITYYPLIATAELPAMSAPLGGRSPRPADANPARRPAKPSDGKKRRRLFKPPSSARRSRT